MKWGSYLIFSMQKSVVPTSCIKWNVSHHYIANFRIYPFICRFFSIPFHIMDCLLQIHIKMVHGRGNILLLFFHMSDFGL